MDYSGNKTAVGQDRAISETESIVSMNLSKDGKTLDLTATYLKEYGAKDISQMESLRPLTTLAFGTNLCGAKGAKWLAQSEVLVNLTSLNLFLLRTTQQERARVSAWRANLKIRRRPAPASTL